MNLWIFKALLFVHQSLFVLCLKIDFNTWPAAAKVKRKCHLNNFDHFPSAAIVFFLGSCMLAISISIDNAVGSLSVCCALTQRLGWEFLSGWMGVVLLLFPNQCLDTFFLIPHSRHRSWGLPEEVSSTSSSSSSSSFSSRLLLVTDRSAANCSVCMSQISSLHSCLTLTRHTHTHNCPAISLCQSADRRLRGGEVSKPFSPHFSTAKDAPCNSNIALEAICNLHIRLCRPGFISPRSWSPGPHFPSSHKLFRLAATQHNMTLCSIITLRCNQRGILGPASGGG